MKRFLHEVVPFLWNRRTERALSAKERRASTVLSRFPRASHSERSSPLPQMIAQAALPEVSLDVSQCTTALASTISPTDLLDQFWARHQKGKEIRRTLLEGGFQCDRDLLPILVNRGSTTCVIENLFLHQSTFGKFCYDEEQSGYGDVRMLTIVRDRMSLRISIHRRYEWTGCSRSSGAP